MIRRSSLRVTFDIDADVAGHDPLPVIRLIPSLSPCLIEGGWLDYPEYHFFWTFHGGNNSVFNTCNYVNPALDKLIDAARFAPNDKVYKESLQGMVNIVMKELPRIPLYRKFADYAVQPNVKGFVYWFHTHPDFRTMYKE